MADETVVEILVERLRQCASKPNDNIEAIRTAAQKLRSRTSSQDKTLKSRTLERLWHKHPSFLPLVLTMLEGLRDSIASCSLAGIVRDCVSPRSGKVRGSTIRMLISLNATNVMVKLVKHNMSQEGLHADEALLQELMWILAQLAQKDSKFAAKARLLCSVKTFHNLLRVYFNNARLLFPILLVMKSLSRNTASTTLLVRDGIVATMEKTLVGIGFTPNPRLRLAMNILSHLSKNKLCCARVAKSGLIILLLRLFDRWDRYEGKTKLRICNYALITLQHLCSNKTARKNIRAQNGLQLLSKFSTSCPDHKSYDALLSRVCGVINLCLERKSLPIEVFMSPATFPLPSVSEYSADLMRSSSSRETTPGSDDDEEDYPEDEDEDAVPHEKEEVEDKGAFYAATIPIQRDIEDLAQYSSNCREFHPTHDSHPRNPTPRSPMNYNVEDVYPYMGSMFSKRELRSLQNSSSISDLGLFNGMQKPLSSTAQMVASISENSFQQKDVERKLGDELSSVMASGTEKKHTTSEHMVTGLSALRNIPSHTGHREVYCTIASRVHSVLPFVKVAYPDVLGGDGAGKLEPLNIKDRKVCRAKLLTCVDRGLHPSQLMNKVVFDLDLLNMVQQQALLNIGEGANKQLYNKDELRVGQGDLTKQHLMFESRFESGNLRKAIQITPREYDLILMPDVNSSKHHQWFYFEVSNMDANIPYSFNIINCEKQNSQFNYGMKPIMYSVKEAMLGRPGWLRVGTDICYYRNSYQNNSSSGKNRSYLTTTFTIVFPHAYDVCYLAYHYPYTYSQLLTQIWKWGTSTKTSIAYFRAESLCLSLNSNETPLLTITAPETASNPFERRETVFLTSRVHPGESNASWVMLGTLNHLLGNSISAIRLLNEYVFKVVPMLNMEGVINGCHRCGLTDEDLNRRWSRPIEAVHPVIYHTKGLMDYCVRVLKKTPVVFCDYHGHSRRKNVFLYGCSNVDSWNQADKALPDDPEEYLLLPQLMQQISPAFALQLCNFKVERAREATARVTAWREFGIRRSYTMESSYCGCDQGLYQGHHLETVHLKEMGASFCEALSFLRQDSRNQFPRCASLLPLVPFSNAAIKIKSLALPMFQTNKLQLEDEFDGSGLSDTSSEDDMEFPCILE